MKARTWLMGGLLVTLAAPGMAFAADTSAFARADSNNDMVVTADELNQMPVLQAYFGVVDRNHDGALDRHEFNRGVATVAAMNSGG